MEIPLTSFVDFVLKSGSPKMTCAKKIKSQLDLPYDPMTDYYKRFREGVQRMHQRDLPKNQLTRLIGALPYSKEVNYTSMIDQYKRFLGRKTRTWFNPPRGVWRHEEIEIPINPELGLEWDDQKYIIKMYLKAEAPSKDRVACILALMNTTLNARNANYCVLDVRNNKLFQFEAEMMDLIPLAEGEANSLKFMLDKL